jgi:nucleoside-diphosphate-sugar epimerase
MWNTADVEAAWKPPPYEGGRAWAVYGASKTQAEQAAWKFMDEHHPKFVLNSVLPNTVFGKILSPENQPGSTAGFIKGIIQSGKVEGFAAYLPPQWFVDVEDTARVHVAALIDPEVRGERLLAFAEPFNWSDVLKVLRGLYPDRTFEFEAEGSEGRDLSELNNERGAGLLRHWFGRDGWTTLAESVRKNTEGL